MQCVEGVEELLLGAGLALEELDVVDEQHVDVAEAGLEGLRATATERAEELVREGLTGRAADAERRVVGQQQVRDRAQQVGLADARRTADEQGVVGLGGHLGDGERRGVREPVGVADDELVEGQLGVAQRADRRAGSRRSGPSRVGGGGRRRAPRARAPRARSAGVSSTVASGPSSSATVAWMMRPKRSSDPATGLRRRGLEHEVLLVELERLQRLEPEPEGGLVDREGELGLYP